MGKNNYGMEDINVEVEDKKLSKFRGLLFSKIKPKNVIILESHPDISGNSLEVFEKLINENVNEQYKIYWVIKERKKYPQLKNKNVSFVPLLPKSFIEKIRKKIIMMSAKLIISENRVIRKENPKTVLIHLHHGTILKNVRGIFNLKEYDCILCPSYELIDLYTDVFNVSEDQIVVNGYPRSDLLFKNTNTLSNLGFDEFSKVVLWMPTFRQHKDRERIDSHQMLPYGIPIVYSEEELLQLNKFLSENKMLLIIKVHPAQDVSSVEWNNLSNITLLFNEDLDKQNIKLYEFIKDTDALLTDYSSIYYDYLLLNKPIALTIDDIKNYNIGFVYNDLNEYLIGEKIKDLPSLKRYLIDVKNEIDPLQEKRAMLNIKMNSKFQKSYTDDLFEKVLKKIL